MTSLYKAQTLVTFAERLLTGVGLEPAKAAAVAKILVEGDLLGHTTHGLQLLPAYLAELDGGQMTKAGSYRVLADFPAALTWDGMRLPGQWLTLEAIDVATERARKMGTCTVVIRRSHHIGCLAAYLQKVTEQGLMILLTCSDPYTTAVAPFGGRVGAFTPNPLAAAWPSGKTPVMFDICQSITTNVMTRRLHGEGRKFPGEWVTDNQGIPSNDPGVMFTNPPGAFLANGGLDHGHKGYAMGLLVEALTGGLAGHGRADPKEGWSATIYIQIIDPALFGGSAEFARQMSGLAETCRATPPRPGVERVRLPGENGLRKKARQLAEGVELYKSILPGLQPWAQKIGVDMPSAE